MQRYLFEAKTPPKGLTFKANRVINTLKEVRSNILMYQMTYFIEQGVMGRSCKARRQQQNG